jgi:hypothetical protein
MMISASVRWPSDAEIAPATKRMMTKRIGEEMNQLT